MHELTAKSGPRKGRSILHMSLKSSMRVLICGSWLLGSVLGSGTLLVAQQPANQDAPAPADNTKTNQRDQNANEATADQQKDNRSDRDITQQIRKAIINDKSLSTYAHNVKIITQDGQVTLKGPVRSEEEKKAIEEKATEIAGENKVTSELAVKPKS
jgi:hyperosmotically inducible protein